MKNAQDDAIGEEAYRYASSWEKLKTGVPSRNSSAMTQLHCACPNFTGNPQHIVTRRRFSQNAARQTCGGRDYGTTPYGVSESNIIASMAGHANAPDGEDVHLRRHIALGDRRPRRHET